MKWNNWSNVEAVDKMEYVIESEAKNFIVRVCLFKANKEQSTIYWLK